MNNQRSARPTSCGSEQMVCGGMIANEAVRQRTGAGVRMDLPRRAKRCATAMAFAAATIAGVVAAQAEPLPQPLADAISKRLDDSLGTNGVPGFAFAIVEKGKGIVFVRRQGQADVEQSRDVDARSVFPYASITKTFTALAIMLLQEDGALSVDDTLAKTLPDFPNADAITLRDLLVHTSGIADFTAIPAFLDAQYRNWTPQALVDLVKAAPVDFAPGAKCSYNDSGYILLGLVVEKVSGKDFMTFVRERISAPLDMQSVAPGDRAAIVPHRVEGYAKVKDTLQNAPAYSLSAPWAAGGLTGNLSDLMMLPGVLRDGGPLITNESRAAMVAPATLANGSPCTYPLPGGSGSYGFGLELVTLDALGTHRAIGKSGVFPGYSGYYALIEGTDYAIGALANKDGSLDTVASTVLDIAALLLKAAAPAPQSGARQ